MAQLVILENGSEVRKLELKRPLVFGKSDDADVQLDRRNISRKHCRVFEQGGNWTIEDLGSRNGTWIDGYRLEQPQRLVDGSRVTLGDFELVFRSAVVRAAAPAKPKVRPAGGKVRPVSEPRAARPVDDGGPTIPVQLKRDIHGMLLEDKDLKAIAADDDEILREKTEEVVRRIVASIPLPGGFTEDELIKTILDEALGLGPIEDLIEDESVTEVMVNNWDTIYVERGGRIELSRRQFTDNRQLMGIIRRILAPIGRRIDESSPLVDARLKDGSRVNAIIPPLALNGPTMTIRKFAKKAFTIDDLINFDTVTPGVAGLLRLAVENRMNILISGGTGSGKTTLLNIISGFIPVTERIVTIEDAAELRLAQEHVVRLESRPANIEGEGAIPIRRLVINSLRMRPDRIVVGECRGGEALDMLQAMNTGHDGSLTTLHANNPRDALARLETLVLMAGMELPAKSIRQQIASAVNIIVQIQRLPDGSRKCTYVSEITGMEGDVISMADIFKFKQTGRTAEGKIQGELLATGTVPKFALQLQESRIPVDMSLFRNPDG